MGDVDLIVLVQVGEAVEDVVGHGDDLRRCRKRPRFDVGRDDIEERGFLRLWMTRNVTKRNDQPDTAAIQKIRTSRDKHSRYDTA